MMTKREKRDRMEHFYFVTFHSDVKRVGEITDEKAHRSVHHSGNGGREANRNVTFQKDKLIVYDAFKSQWKPRRMRDRWQAHLDINLTTIHYSVSNEKFICPNERR